MLQYSSNLHIDETTTTVTIELSKIIIGSMQLAGTIFCTILVDRIGRKVSAFLPENCTIHMFNVLFC